MKITSVKYITTMYASVQLLDVRMSSQ